jgi:DNA modification methylase
MTAPLKNEVQDDINKYGLEVNKLYNEDCLIGMQKIKDKSIDMILCDLPYGTTQNKWDSIIPLTDYIKVV